MDSEEGFTGQLGGTTELLKDLSIKQGTNQESVSGHLDEDKRKAKFNKFIQRAKELGRQGQIEEALHLFEKAYDINQSEKLYKKIKKLKEAIEIYREEEQEEEEEEEDNGMREVSESFYLPTEIHQALYPYQLEGVLWFWRLYKQGKGGILGDDMGLGKTIQVISFLAGMFDAELIQTVLIVMPVSLMTNWEKEFNTWAPGIRVKAFHGSNKKERMRNLEKVQRKTGVCLTTYGLVVSSHEALGSSPNGSTYTWDYIILDEGHKIKNTTKTSKNVREIPAKNHFILTGTPVQNNLREMWALFDFACEGKLLGTSRTFKQEYEGPIVRARERDASAYEKRIGMEMSESLRKLIEPHFLRRTKAMVLEKKKHKTDNTDGTEEGKENKRENPVKMPGKLTRKNDFIIWLFMSDTQLKIYSDFLGLERVKEMLMSTRSPLAELNVLKKICDHPRLLSTLACEQLGLDEEDRNVDLHSSEELQVSFATQPKGSGPSDRVLIQESGKMVFLVALLENLKAEGHRCLIFSQSRKMLDIIQRVITHMGHKILRIDGTITSTAERQHLINTFQTDSSYSCFLLTTQVGGVGITLTAADRVVIFDPSWNPATDAQAVDRVYRIGQKKTVVIYRLITCGTLEEKIYRKQIFKDALMKQTTGMSKNPFRYFTRQELRDLFTLDDPYTSKTQLQLDSMHSQHRKTDEILDKHIKFLQTLNIFGITDHDLMYSQEDVETPDEMNGFSDSEAIQARVLRAQNLMAAEAGRSSTGGGTYPARPVPASCPRPTGRTPAHPEIIALPQGLRQSLPLREEALTAKQKVQARIDSERFIVPKREDTTRFQPRQLVQHVSPILPPPAPVVVDLTSPVQPASSPTPDEMHSDSLLDLAELDKPVNGEDLEEEFASLNIGSSDSRKEAVAWPGSSTFNSEQEESCVEATPNDWPPKDEFSDTAAKKKESRRRKSMSQRIELPEIDDSDGEQFDETIKEGEEGLDLIVSPHSRDNSIVQQNESTEEWNCRRSSHEPAVERDFDEEYLINEIVSNNSKASEGSIPIPFPEPVIDQPSEIIDSEGPEHCSSLCETADDDVETKDLSERSRVNENSESECDVIKSDFTGSVEEPRDHRVVDQSLQSTEREFANDVSLSQDSYEEAETSDNEIVDGTDSAACPTPLIDDSSEGVGIEVPPSPTADNSNDEERPDVSVGVRADESSVDESFETQDDDSQSEDHMKSEELAGAKHRVGVRQIISDDEDDSAGLERDEPNDFPYKDELPTRQKRIRRIDSVGSESDNAEDVEKFIPESRSPRAEKAEDLDDEQIHQVQGDDVSEKDEDSGNISDVETHDATGSSITNGSQSSSVESCESQSPSSSSSRGECDELSPKSSRGTRPRVRHLVSSGDESDEGGDGEYAFLSTEGCVKDQILEVEYSCKKNEAAESICQENNGSWSLVVRDENSSSSMDECSSAADNIRCCPTGLHTSDAIEIHKCACVVSEEDQRKYHKCLDIARQLQLAGKAKEVFLQYLTALDIMDSELELHKKVLRLAKTTKLH